MAFINSLNRIRNFFTATSGQQPVQAGWLFFFRINVACFALIHFLSIQPDFADFYSGKAYVYPDILDASYDQLSVTFTGLQAFLQQLHINVAYESLVFLARLGYPVALLFLMMGMFTRASAIAALFLQLLFIKSIHLYEYGVDYFTTIALFYCCVFPVGRVMAADNYFRKKKQAPVYQHLCLRLLRAHLCIAYFFSGFDKVIGPTWRNGEAIWKSLHSHNYYNLFNLDFLATGPFFLLIGWATVITEMLYPLGMQLTVIRRYWGLAVIAMHVFIALFMGLFFFSAMMVPQMRK